MPEFQSDNEANSGAISQDNLETAPPGATGPAQTAAEILEARRSSARAQKSQAEALSQDTAQLEKDIAELDALLKDRDKTAAAAADQEARWRKERAAIEAFQKSRAKAVGEELGDRKDAVVAVLGDHATAVGTLQAAAAEAMRRYLAAQTAVAQSQALHDAAKARLAVLRQHVADGQKARQALDDRRIAGFAALRKQIEGAAAPEPAYAMLLFLRTELDGAADPAVPAPATAATGVNSDLAGELDLDFDALWRELDALKEELRKRRAAAKEAKDALDVKQAELDAVVQRRRAEVLKALEPRA